MKLIKIIGVVITLMCVFTFPTWAAPLAGHVILSKGQVTATSDQGTDRILKRRSEIFNGDVIKTGATGSVQIRFVDKALMTIKANSEMNIESYLMAQKGADKKDEKVLMSLVKGGFRTITGTIGKGDKSAYKVNTPAASIGIRGTNYEVQQEADGSFVMGVYSGGIQVENESGSLDLGDGADFNFTRVKPKSSPKGLLAPPVTLAENNATEESDEESESSDGEADKEQVASEETTEEGDENQEDSSGESNDKDDAQGKTIIAQVGGDNDSSNDSTTNADLGGTESNADSSNTLDALASLNVNVDENVSDALDTALTDKIEDVKDEFVETGGTDQLLEDALIEAGILSEGQTVDDLDPELLVLVELWELNPTSIEALIASIQAQLDVVAAQPFDFTDPYANIDATGITNPFTQSIISDEALALGESGDIAVLAMPINSSNNYSGDSPAISTLEAQLMSPDIVNFTPFDYSTENVHFRISYDVINIGTGEKTRYEIEISMNEDIVAFADFNTFLFNSVVENDVFVEVDGQFVQQTNPGHITVSFNAETQKFDFIPTTGSDEFILEMELNYDNSNTSTAAIALQQSLGSGSSTTQDHWYAESGLDLFIGNGSWEGSTDRPILVMKDSHSHQDADGTVVTDDRLEVVMKPLEADNTVSSLAGFASCIDSQQTCDIQVNSVSAADNIRWGAWLAEPGEGIEITKFEVNENVIETQQEENILAFWLAAERADINQLTGSANFTTDSDCARFGQCIGFADDGIVQSLTANFDVDFNSGAITNGNLVIETTEDPDLGLLGGSGAVESTWNVNFSGQMSADQNNNRLPEFQTHTLNGTVVDSGNAADSSTSVIGNIGGIFVKPGDVFAGGYNLGTADTNKHAAGVFTMEKTP
ncbi:hypothetical protein NBRC116188_08770 [Oceaniserpentilla sp. 4NH20-0058]|uniref:FecR family protein n=1 Tax=Oceaniserpentilla sp. 4NH20-0058 TaxID=3127660 RepID=UPI0031042CD0